MKYREDMMENHEKGPGMRSDRLGITTNVLPLEVSSHVLEGERDGGEMLLVGFGGEKRETSQYKSSLADPTILCTGGSSAVHGRTVRQCIQNPV